MSMIEYTVDGAVAIIRLDRPPVNALSDEFAAEILEAVQDAPDHPALDAVRLDQNEGGLHDFLRWGAVIRRSLARAA